MAACSIIIPVHDRAALTRRCLDALLEQGLPDVEIVVVDDASTDLTPRLLASYGDRITLVRCETSGGFAAACNLGAERASAESILLLNNDTIPLPGWYEALRDHAAAHPEAGVVGARLLYPDGTIQHAGMCISERRWPAHLYAGLPGDHAAVTRSRRLQLVTGACALIPGGRFGALGGFDEEYRNGYEDVDLCLRMAEAGHEIHYCAEAVLYHLEFGTRGEEDMSLNEARFDRRWRSSVQPDQLRILSDDGMIELLREGSGLARLRVSPLVALPEVDDHELLELLAERTERGLELVRENHRLRHRGHADDRLVFAYDADGTLAPAPATRAPARPASDELRLADQLAATVAPQALDIDAAQPERVNVLIDQTEPATLHTGAFAALRLAALLAERGRRVRVLALGSAWDAPDARAAREGSLGPGLWPQTLELVPGPGRDEALAVHPRDAFVATSWSTAHIADRAVTDLRQRRFVYFVHEYAPLRYPGGSFAALARASHDLDHHAVIAGALLEEYLRDGAAGRRDAVVVDEVLAAAPPEGIDSLRRDGPRRVLFHAGPPSGDPQTLTELGFLALERAVQAGTFAGEWRFTAFGAGRPAAELSVGGAPLQMLPLPDLAHYRELLRTHDVGLAPHADPHPGIVALEMARAGLAVVTTTFANKTPEALRAISANLLASAPTVADIGEALTAAVARVDDTAARLSASELAGAGMAERPPDDTLAAIERLLDDARAPA